MLPPSPPVILTVIGDITILTGGEMAPKKALEIDTPKRIFRHIINN